MSESKTEEEKKEYLRKMFREHIKEAFPLIEPTDAEIESLVEQYKEDEGSYDYDEEELEEIIEEEYESEVEDEPEPAPNIPSSNILIASHLVKLLAVASGDPYADYY